MRVLFVTSTPFPNGMAATNRIRNYGIALSDNNIETEVVVYRSTEKVNNKKNNDNGIWQSIKYKYPFTSIRSNSFIKRRFDDLRDIIWTLHYIFKSKSEVVFIYMNSFFVELLAIIAAKLSNKKLIRELCEYPYYKDCLYSKANLKLFRYYNGIIAISHELELLAKNTSKNTKILKVPILINTNKYSAEKYQNERPYIFHGGTLTESKDAIISTMKAFALANKQLKGSVDFLLAGPNSSDLAVLKQIVSANSLQDNVKFLGVIPAEEIKKYQNGASLCVLNKNDTLQNRCGFSTKLGEILLSETAVITTTIGEANFWLKNDVSAYITEPHKPELIADLIVKAFSNENQRTTIAKKGKEIAIKNFAISIQGPRLAEFINIL